MLSDCTVGDGCHVGVEERRVGGGYTLKDGRRVRGGTFQPDPVRTIKGAVLHTRIKREILDKSRQMCHRIGENLDGEMHVRVVSEVLKLRGGRLKE